MKIKSRAIEAYKSDSEREKAALIFDSAMLSGITCVLFSIFSLYIDFYYSFWLTLVYASILISSTIILLGRKSIYFISRLHIGLLFCLIVMLVLLSGGFTSPVLLWLITIPLTLLWLKNDIWVLVSLIVVIGLFISLYLLDKNAYLSTIYLPQENLKIYSLICHIGLVFLVVSICSNFDIEKLNAYKKVENQNVEIENQNKIISAALDEKEILLKEIHHRVKNNLQIVSSLLGIQSRSIIDNKAKEAINEGRTRVHSMSLIHQDLYRKDNLTGVEMQNYLPKLASNLFDTYNIQGDHINLILDIDDIKLDVDTVIPIGLIVNELITNTLKYAFPGNRKGNLNISLTEINDTLLLIVVDDGIGLKQIQRETQEKSFGHSLIRAFKTKLDADIDISSLEGTSVSISIKKYKKL